MEEPMHLGPIPRDPTIRQRMRAQKVSDTRPELQLRSELHRRGLRYRVGLKVPGMPRRTIDIAFTKSKVAVFVDGCFWHQCPEHSVPVKHNSTWWASKLKANVERDRDTTAQLEESGWQVLRIWEHLPVEDAATRVEEVLSSRRLS